MANTIPNFFPDHFTSKPHGLIPNSTQWMYEDEDGNKISVVGGGDGLCGNGVTTFEMWDSSEDEPRGYMSKEEINNYINLKYNNIRQN